MIDFNEKCAACGHVRGAHVGVSDRCPDDRSTFTRDHGAPTGVVPRVNKVDVASSALDRQEGGSHYKDMAIQPVQFIVANKLGFCEGNVVKYVCRWRAKGGVEDLKKARHYLDLLIEQVHPAQNPSKS